jgi:hypothetical protein
LGTDDHNVRTTTDGKIQITTPNDTNNVWEFDTDGNLTIPGDIIAGGGTAQVGSILTIATNNTGGLGGYDVDALSVAYNADILSTFVAGSTITFADNSTALITGVSDETTYIDIFIDTFQDPFDSIFPITLTTANYVAGDLDPINIVVGNSTWAFGQNGGVTFPDATVQTTAYPSGQQTILVDETSALGTEIDLNSLTGTVILILPADGYTTTGDTHTVNLPILDSIPLGTRITVINRYDGVVTVNGWFGPGWQMAPYSSIDLVYHFAPEGPANMWWVTGNFIWD